MKKIAAVVVFGLALSVAGAEPSFADHTSHPEIAKAIQVQAEAVRSDAKIYQRSRVSSEVQRIVSDVNALDKLVAPHDCLKANRAALKVATGQLRRASVNSDADATTQAVNHIAEVSTKIIKTTCSADLK
jgi:hypothetical protein